MVGHAASDFTKYYVLKYLIRVGRSKMSKTHLTSYVNAPQVLCFPPKCLTVNEFCILGHLQACLYYLPQNLLREGFYLP